MVEPIMYGAIGFLIAGLLVIGFIPLVHARAERLTTRRLGALTPLSMAEIQAADTETQELEARLRRKTTEAAKLNEQLAEERGRAEHFAGRATELDRTLFAYK